MSLRYSHAESADLVLVTGDITRADTDAIVNAANAVMLGGGGVDGAIHRAAGPALVAACRAIPAVDGKRCPPGEARLTPGFALPAPWVIHTVGPIYEDEDTSEPILTMAYRSCLALARDNRLRTLAFPAISCGVFGYPHADAAYVALTTCQAHGHDLDEIRFVLFDEAMYNVWAGVGDDLFD
jgi:O-acetyl-ADP-ribose deacetylase (regulator of RNase III)